MAVELGGSLASALLIVLLLREKKLEMLSVPELDGFLRFREADLAEASSSGASFFAFVEDFDGLVSSRSPRFPGIPQRQH